MSHNYWALCPGAHAPQKKQWQREACAPQLKGNPRSPQLEENPCSNEDPAQPQNKYTNTIIFKKCYKGKAKQMPMKMKQQPANFV